MEIQKRIALVAHDNCKKDMVEWVEWNWSLLLDHQLICTGTTGRLVEQALARQVDEEHPIRYPLLKLKSGPFGGDQQLGSNDRRRRRGCPHLLLGSDAAPTA